MRIIFMGASEIGWECCKLLFEQGKNIVGIFSIRKEFIISWSKSPVTNVRFRNFEDLSQQYHSPIIYVTHKLTDPYYQRILIDLKPDILIVIGWYYMIPRSIRYIATYGAIGIHASILPKYRGGAPLVWAIINGETKTGVTLFYLEDGVDDGDIIAQGSLRYYFRLNTKIKINIFRPD
jgi:methionyl-tRNA formyltransferase